MAPSGNLEEPRVPVSEYSFKEQWQTIKYALLALCFGAVLFSLSYLPSVTGSLKEIMSALGLALLTAMVAAIALEMLVSHVLLYRVKRIQSAVEEGSQIMKAASELGVEYVFARRSPSDSINGKIGSEKIEDAIKAQIQSTGELLIVGVAAPKIFRFDQPLGKMLYDAIKEGKFVCKLRVLLLCPDSKWAITRTEIEKFHNPIKDIETAADYLRELKNLVPDRVFYQCYSVLPPIVFLIVTEQKVFVEPYPLAEVVGPVGGKTPMLTIGRKSDAYELWEKHFDYIWNEQNKLSQDYQTHHPQVLNKQ